MKTASAPSSARSPSADSGTFRSVSENSIFARRGVENHQVVTRSVCRPARIPHPMVRWQRSPGTSGSERLNSTHR
ncbi:MAG: hypothetical protein GEV09_20855 [Pseudonocardiaceae bacterium]|nr:hypothetical protein [Pseudonocardiaceae bacterium]